MPHHSICVLAGWEIDNLNEQAIEPDCRNHTHITRMEANQRTHFPNGDSSPYHQPVAQYIGKGRIRMIADRAWRVVGQTPAHSPEGPGFPRLNLVQK